MRLQRGLHSVTFTCGRDPKLPDNGKNPTGSGAPSDEVGSLTVGPDPRVTYWNTDLRAVEDFLFRSCNR
ncbi:hypothetical protein [Streptomyces sp. 147326]|uniref:hypothetical protein n=1 Tax=Streptomyces sp. 147326 TaxID=3074379 RepID=UPI003857B86E